MTQTRKEPINQEKEPEEPPSGQAAKPQQHSQTQEEGFLDSLANALNIKKRNEPNLREALEEYIEDDSEVFEDESSAAAHEKMLLANVLKLRDETVVGVMVPRADIIAIPIETSQSEILQMLAEKQYSRLPVYTETLDNVIGTVHIKDILSVLAQGKEVIIRDLLREVPIVSPTMPILDLLLQMRQSQKHMSMVVDEYGGIDGLVTIGDVIEAIIGQIDDEYDQDKPPEFKINNDGSISIDARFEIEDFEEQFGEIFSDEDREESETLGGLVFTIAGRIPARGEVIHHDNGPVFEILEADPRRISRIRIRNVKAPALKN